MMVHNHTASYACRTSKKLNVANKGGPLRIPTKLKATTSTQVLRLFCDHQKLRRDFRWPDLASTLTFAV